MDCSTVPIYFQIPPSFAASTIILAQAPISGSGNDPAHRRPPIGHRVLPTRRSWDLAWRSCSSRLSLGPRTIIIIIDTRISITSLQPLASDFSQGGPSLRRSSVTNYRYTYPLWTRSVSFDTNEDAGNPPEFRHSDTNRTSCLVPMTILDQDRLFAAAIGHCPGDIRTSRPARKAAGQRSRRLGNIGFTVAASQLVCAGLGIQIMYYCHSCMSNRHFHQSRGGG